MITVIYNYQEWEIVWYKGMTVDDLLEACGNPDCIVVRIKDRNGQYQHVSKINFFKTLVPNESKVFLVPMIVGG